MYGNEKEVGEAIGKSGLDRADVFVTSKLNNGFHRPDDARRAFDGSLDALGIELRRPVPDPLAAADPVRRRLRVDLADPRGVLPRRAGPVDRRVELPAAPPATGCTPRCEIPPAVNQIEVHPYLTQDDVRAFCARASDRHRSVVADRAGHGPGRPDDRRRSPASVGQERRPRWCCAGTSSAATSSSRSRSPRPGSGRTSSIFDFELSGEDTEAITALNRNQRTGPDPDTFDMIPD